MHTSPADELADIRAEMLRLRAREAALRQQILKDPDGTSIGRWHRVEVDEHRDLVLDISRLPEHILQDRHFWCEKLVQTLRCLPAATPVSRRPGWPIRREAGTALH
jgi:hypothetical protein